MSKTSETIKATYKRDPVPAARMGQCPCCLKSHRSSAKGTLTRHGWKETGRQVGQHGMGFQWGACIGSGMRPLEETDRDALEVLVRLRAHKLEVAAQVARHAAGAESYTYTIELAADRLPPGYAGERKAESPEALASLTERTASLVKALGKLGYATKVSETRAERRSFRTTSVPARKVAVEVARGAEETALTYKAIDGKKAQSYHADSTAFTVKSYESLRAADHRHYVELLESLERQDQAIVAAIKHHRENPSNGSADTVRRGKLVHLTRVVVLAAERCAPGATLEQRTRRSLACGARKNTMGGYRHLLETTDPNAVTCPKCKEVRS